MVPNGLVIELKAIKKAPWDSQKVDCGHFEPLKKVRFTVIKTNDLPAFSRLYRFDYVCHQTDTEVSF